MVSVIVPTYRRERPLRDILGDLAAQQYEPFEVVVVDQTERPAEETRAFVASLGDRVRYIRRETPNLPAARNAGIREARGEIIVFVDDDARVRPDFLAAHARNYTDPAIMAVAGSVLGERMSRTSTLPREAGDPLLRTFCGCWQYDRRMEVVHAPGGNHSFRREVAERAGFFDESFAGPGFREETDFFMRVSAAGLRIVYDPECWIIHPPQPSDGGCWAGFDGVPSAARFANHGYFILKNFPRRHWPRLFLHSFRATFFRRETLRHPSRNFRRLARFASGWREAWRRARRRRDG